MASDRPSGNARRFRPELVESTSRSSKVHNTRDPQTFPTSSQSSSSLRSDPQITDINQRRPHNDENKSTPIATEKPRRFLPQPTETSSRSSKKHVITHTGDSKDSSESSQLQVGGLEESDSKKPPRPLPQPFEVKKSNGKVHSQSTNHSSESGIEENKGSNTVKARRKFRPEPIETVKLSRRKQVKVNSGSNSSSSQSTPRKFTPQLIETGKRSFRRADTDDAAISNGITRPSSPPVSRGQQIVAAGEGTAFPAESRFSYASLLQRQEGRRHSFRVPDLPAIPSNSSEGSEHSDLPSLSTTPSAASSEASANRLAAKNRFRESCDERFSGYLLSLAARSAEKQLRDQALAAFPNEQEHQPVSHFAIDGDEEFGDEDLDPVVTIPPSMNRDTIFRRESIADLAWELEEMRRHKEVAEMKDMGVHKSDAHESRFSAAAIAARQPERPDDEASLFAGWRRDLGLAQMRHAASPPMLGDDIVFPLSASPQGTASETDHMITVSQTEPEPIGHGDQTGLWTAEMNVEGEDKPGLWMGLCHKEEGDEEESQFHKIKTGIATPRIDVGAFDGSYFDLKHLDEDEMQTDADTELPDAPADIRLPKNPIIAAPEEENPIDVEFHDGFVTQVYNYLSLGYPSLARYFDVELSKISGIPITDLRQDDLEAEAKGYVVAVPSDGAASVTNTDAPCPEKCIRWKALRLYISEWARQQPEIDLNNDESLDAWGVIERRGSWAV